MFRVILCRKVILCFVIIIMSNASFAKEEILRRNIRHGLDSVAQGILKSQNPNILHAYKFNSGIENREELVIDSIRSDDEFNIGQEVTEWQSLNVLNKSYAVGKTPSGFVVVVADLGRNDTFLVTSKLLTLQISPTAAYTMYKMWNIEQMKYDIFLIVASASSNNNVQWFRITENLILERIWWWNLPQKVTHIKIFEVGRYVKLLVIYERLVTSETTTADIYDIDLERTNYTFRLLQSLNLKCSSKTTAINKLENEVYLSIPQQITNSVHIYKFINNKFIQFLLITSQNVAIVTDFKIGQRSFLAIGGQNSGIYQLTKEGFVKEEIIDINFEEVTYYLPLPIKSYRDEVVLLVQHHIDYISHVAPHVKVLVYSKRAFHVHDEIPCRYFGVSVDGATCIADPERISGITGSAMLSSGKVLAVLVPREQVQSGLFYFDWMLKELANPVTKKLDRIIKSRINVEKLLQQQRNEILGIQSRLSNALSIDTDNEITGNWRVNIITTPNLISPDMRYSDPDETQESQEFSFDSDFKIITDEIDSLQVKILKTRSVDVKQDIVFDHLNINGNLDVQEGSIVENLFVEKVNGDEFDNLVEDCVRRSEKNLIPGSKIFKKMNVESLTFAKLNNISAENIAYNRQNTVQIEGNLTFKTLLDIQENVELFEAGMVNNMDFRNEVVYMNSDTTYTNVLFENLNADYINYVTTVNDIYMEDIIKYKDINQGGLNIETDYLDLTNVNITAKHINDQEFKSFVKTLCLINRECKLPGNIKIHGKMHVKGFVDINKLNQLHYPDGYVLNEIHGFTKITGKKVFVGNVSTTEVIVNNLVNNINPDEVITCTTKQIIPGNFTFADLEITESFKVDGDIFIGPELDKFIPNPTLEDRNILDSNALFEQLEIDGLVMVSNLFNGSTLKVMLEDVVYKDEKNVPINVEKKLTKKLTIQNNLNVNSGTINNVVIKKILTYNTEQLISNEIINGDVVIENLEVSGLLTGKNLASHFKEFIRLDTNEIVNSKIIFKNIENHPDIVASEIHLDEINNMNLSDFILTIGDRNLQNVEFKSLKADNVEFRKDLNIEIECFDVDDYAKNRFSLTKNQTVIENIRIVNGYVENIYAENINDIAWDFIKHFLNISDIFSKKLFSGQFKIVDLQVDKSVTVENFNNKNVNDILDTVYWLKKSNNLIVDIVFEGDCLIADKLKIIKLNGANFHKYIDDIILKSEESVVFDGYKYFKNGFTIEENLNVNKINNMPVENILLRSNEQQIFGHMIVHRNVLIQDNINIKKFLNNFPINYFQEHFRMDRGIYVLKGNVSFQHYVTIDNLQLKGNANGMPPEYYLSNIVGIYDDISISDTTEFKNKVRITKNLGIASSVDGVDLNKVMKEVVLISRDEYVQGLVAFKENVQVIDTVELETNLETRYLCGCDVNNWVDNAVYIINGYLPGKYKFEKVLSLKNLKTSNINGVTMNNLIPLNTDQTINASLDLGLIKTENNIEVDGFINGFNFENEYQNTVMTNKDQKLNSHLIFLGPIIIAENLKTFGFVNGKDLTRLVTTDIDQNLTASYFFNGKVSLDVGLITSGKLNDISVKDWRRRTVTATGGDTQDVDDKWTVAGNVTFLSDVIGNGLIGDMNVKQLTNKVDSRRWDKLQIENVIKNDYKEICKNVQNLVKISKQRPFSFKHLEHHEKLKLEHDISAIHYFKYNHRHYLIMSQKDNCRSLLYEWMQNSFKFKEKLFTGEVDQFITVLDSNRVYLVTKHSKTSLCENLGVNVWIFTNDTLMHIYGLDHSVLIQKSKLPGTFYSVDNKSVTEYKLFYKDENTVVHAYKQWDTPNDIHMYNPNNYKLSMPENTDNNKVKRSDERQEYVEPEYEETNVGIANHYLPAAHVKEYLDMKVGHPENRLKLTAVAVWEEATITGLSDEIRILDDFNNGKLFDKIATLRPSNLNVLQLGRTDETFLVFLEDYKILKLYEFKGIEGFKHRSSTNIAATKMISVALPVQPFRSKRKFLLLVYKNTLTILQAFMYGDRTIENFQCEP